MSESAEQVLTAPAEGDTVSLLHWRVAANVRAEAARHGDRQVTISDLLQLSQQQISARFKGRVAFTIDELGVLADRYGMTAGQLVDGWAPRGSNSQPADYKMAGSGAAVLTFPRHAARRGAGPVITRRAS